MAYQAITAKKILPILLTLVAAGCASNNGIDDDNFDVDESDLPPLATLNISQIVIASKQCQSEVTKLWEARSSIPKNKVREFHLYMGKTSEACTRLQHYVNELRKAGLAQKYYQQNLKMTRSIVSSGTGSAAETPLFTDIENAPMMKPRKAKSQTSKRPASPQPYAVVEADDPMAELNPHLPTAQINNDGFDTFDTSAEEE